MILTDAGPLIAILDRSDPDHERCTAVLAHETAPMLSTWPAFAEAMYLLGDRAGWYGQEKLWQLVQRGHVHLHGLSEELVKRTQQLMARYKDVPMDLADATLVAVAEDLRLQRVFTIDADFRIYRLPRRRSFELVP